MTNEPHRRALMIGDSVTLRKALYEYPAGSRGVIIGSPLESAGVLVRFESTGHGAFVPPDLLNQPEGAAEETRDS